MFDIGFWEIAMLMLIALIVIGPERLPRLARTAGLWFSKATGFISSVKADIDKELNTEEIRKSFQDSDLAKDIRQPIDEIIEETKRTKPMAAEATSSESKESK